MDKNWSKLGFICKLCSRHYPPVDNMCAVFFTFPMKHKTKRRFYLEHNGRTIPQTFFPLPLLSLPQQKNLSCRHLSGKRGGGRRGQIDCFRNTLKYACFQLMLIFYFCPLRHKNAETIQWIARCKYPPYTRLWSSPARWEAWNGCKVYRRFCSVRCT